MKRLFLTRNLIWITQYVLHISPCKDFCLCIKIPKHIEYILFTSPPGDVSPSQKEPASSDHLQKQTKLLSRFKLKFKFWTPCFLIVTTDWKPIAHEKHGKHNQQRRDLFMQRIYCFPLHNVFWYHYTLTVWLWWDRIQFLPLFSSESLDVSFN